MPLSAGQNTLHAVIVESTIGRGTISSIDTTAAEKSPGVKVVITSKNMIDLPKPKKRDVWRKAAPLSDMNVYYAGQHVAVVVADTLERAKDAASKLKIGYDAKTPIISLYDPAAPKWKSRRRILPARCSTAVATWIRRSVSRT